jgi:16S rRNA (uracil1498-N3)-methyltransferase
MQYLHHRDAGLSQLTLEGDSHRYLFKVRRHRAGDRIYLRSGRDDILYRYRITDLDKKTAQLALEEQNTLPIGVDKVLHIGWCQIDPKNIEKVLPMLNEMGVGKITFFPCARSQQNFKADFSRMEKILLNSSQQCGRSRKMPLEQVESLEAFLASNPEAYLLHFAEQTLPCDIETPLTIVIGAEGGLTEDEAALFAPKKIIGLGTPMILRSESAAVAVAGRVLL